MSRYGPTTSMRPPTFVLCAVLLCPGASSWNSSTVWGQTTGAKPDPVVGKKLFQEHCSACHGLEGGGGRGPNLHTPTLKHASDENGLRALIGNGISPQMPPAWYLTAVRPCTLKPTAVCVTRWPAREAVLGPTSPRSELDAEQLSCARRCSIRTARFRTGSCSWRRSYRPATSFGACA